MLGAALVGIAMISTGGIVAAGDERPEERDDASLADAPRIDSKVELFVHDVDASRDFYAILGFKVVHEKPTGYTTLARGPAVIALSPMPGWLPVHWLGFLKTPPLGTELVFYVADLEAVHAAFEQAGHGPGEITLQAWGDLDFRLRDPDGYYVRVSEGSALPEAP